MQIAKVNAMLTATASVFKKTFSDAGKDAESFADKLKGVKAKLGEESVFGSALKSLRGAGALAGVGLAARELDGLARKITDLNNQYSAGKITVRDYADELIRSIPVIGSLGTALGELAFSFTAAGKEAAKALAQGAEANEFRKQAIQFEKEAKSAQAILDSVASQIERDEISLIPESDVRAKASALADYNDQLKKIAEQEKKFKELGGLPSIDFMQARVTAMQKYEAELAKLELETAQKFIKGFMERTFATVGPTGGADVAGGIGDFIKNTMQAGTDLINNAKAKLFADSKIIPEAPQLLQAGSQAAASFVARAQREQAAKANDPATVAAKETAKNTGRQNELLEQINSNLSQPVELI